MELSAQYTVKKVEVYGVSWKLRTRRAITIKDVKKRSDYHFVLKDSDIDDLFDDYKDFKELLMSQDTVFYFHNVCIAYVKVHFSVKKITLYFRENGDYYFNGKWYKPNYELYYYIFGFFNKDAMMPNEIIEKGKKIAYEKRKIPYDKE
jgi:hypothetical protein